MQTITSIINQTIKSAKTDVYPQQYIGLAQQNFLPVSKRRKLSDEEIAFIEQEKSKWIPKIFKSMGDHPAVDMHSPVAAAILQGLIGAALGGFAGHALTHNPKNPNESSPGAYIGAGLGGLLGGALGYFNTDAKNETIMDMISRIPEGGTRRDVLADPVYAQMALLAQENAKSSPVGNNTNLPNWLLKA